MKDASDIPTGYALVNGRRAVYILVTKRADASTLSVVNNVKRPCPACRRSCPTTSRSASSSTSRPPSPTPFAAWSPRVRSAPSSTGLMVLLFLRDWRSVIVVVLNIPFALCGALVAMWLTGQTINLMTLGGLALAIGILVDESTVEVENIHHQMEGTSSVARAVRRGNQQTAIPRLLAMLCVLAVFIPSFFMQGAAQALFVPLSLAVGFAMVTSYLLSSTFVPVLSTWLLRHHHHLRPEGKPRPPLRIRPSARRLWPGRGRRRARALGDRAGLPRRHLRGDRAGGPVARPGDLPQGRRRPVPAPDAGARRHAVRRDRAAGDRGPRVNRQGGRPRQRRHLVGYVGLIPSSYPINAIYQWTGGPEEAILRVAMKKGAKVDIERLKERLRRELSAQLPGVRLSFEPADIVSEVMSFGSPTPVDVAVTGPNLADDRAFAEKLRTELNRIPSLRDLHFGQSLDYPTINIDVDRERARLERRDRRGCRPLGRGGHVLQPLHGPQLLARPQDRHRLPGAGRDPLPDHGLARDASRRYPSSKPAWTGKSSSATWRTSARGRCRANSTATT